MQDVTFNYENEFLKQIVVVFFFVCLLKDPLFFSSVLSKTTAFPTNTRNHKSGTFASGR